MICGVDTIKAAEFDICYMAGTEIGNNSTFAVTDENDLAVDLTGATLEMQVKYKPEDPESRAIITFKTSDGTITISGAENNYITLRGQYQVDEGLRVHDIWWEEQKDYLGKGFFKITANATRT